jgi:glycosyltransferase involved in cell wall biosynthesis
MKLSIITCTLNSEKFLSECLLSISQQVFRNFELIIIDGYSTDKTGDIISKFFNKLPVRIFKQKPEGISTAMNYGIKKAQGDFLIHLHADDFLYNKYVLKEVNEFLEKNKTLDWIYGKINSIEENGRSIGIFPNNKVFQIGWNYLLKYTNYIPHQAVFIRTEVFEKYGYFDDTLSSAMDTDLWLRIGSKTEWKFYNRIISYYRTHPSAQSSGISNQLINMKNHENVQKRYTNPIEFILCKFINQLIWRMYRRKNLR